MKMLLTFISASTAPISSNPLWIPHNTPSVQQGSWMMAPPITLPHISDSARLPASNQVSADVLKRLNNTKYLPPPPKSIGRGWIPSTPPWSLNAPSVWRHRTFTITTTRGLSSYRESISALLMDVLTSLLYLRCIDSRFYLPDVIKWGETPFMGLEVREKSTGNNSTSLNEEKRAEIIFKNNSCMLKCNKKSSSHQFCVFSYRKELQEHLKRQMA